MVVHTAYIDGNTLHYHESPNDTEQNVVIYCRSATHYDKDLFYDGYAMLQKVMGSDAQTIGNYAIKIRHEGTINISLGDNFNPDNINYMASYYSHDGSFVIFSYYDGTILVVKVFYGKYIEHKNVKYYLPSISYLTVFCGMELVLINAAPEICFVLTKNDEKFVEYQLTLRDYKLGHMNDKATPISFSDQERITGDVMDELARCVSYRPVKLYKLMAFHILDELGVLRFRGVRSSAPLFEELSKEPLRDVIDYSDVSVISSHDDGHHVIMRFYALTSDGLKFYEYSNINPDKLLKLDLVENIETDGDVRFTRRYENRKISHVKAALRQ